MTRRETEFWTGENKYQELAREFEESIELRHPNRVTSKRMCPCLDYCSWCGWAATSVKYYEYRGERV